MCTTGVQVMALQTAGYSEVGADEAHLVSGKVGDAHFVAWAVALCTFQQWSASNQNLIPSIPDFDDLSRGLIHINMVRHACFSATANTEMAYTLAVDPRPPT